MLLGFGQFPVVKMSLPAEISLLLTLEIYDQLFLTILIKVFAKPKLGETQLFFQKQTNSITADFIKFPTNDTEYILYILKVRV